MKLQNKDFVNVKRDKDTRKTTTTAQGDNAIIYWCICFVCMLVLLTMALGG